MLRFNIGQMLLLTALAALVVALGTTLYTRARGMFRPQTVAYSPAGDAVAARYSDGTVIVWSDTGRRLGSFDTYDGWINWPLGDNRIHLLSADRLLASNEAGRLQLWDVTTGKPSRPFGPANFGLGGSSVGVSGDGNTIVATRVGAATPAVEIWDVTTAQKVKQMPGSIGHPAALALSEDGSRLAALSQFESVEVWDVESESVVSGPHTFAGRDFLPDRLLDISVDLRVVANLDPGRYDAEQGWPIELMETATGQVANVYVDHEVGGIRLAPDGTKLAVLGPNDAVTILNTQDGETICKIEPVFKIPAYNLADFPTYSSPPMSFSPDGSEVMVASNVEVGIYDATTGKLNKRLWHSQASLSKWFFMPAFIGWGVFWGVARRRQRQSMGESDQEVVNADVVDSQGEVTDSRLPRAMIATWILLAIGGVVAIVWGMLILFAEPSCLVFTPFPYFSLYVGLVTLSAGAGRRTDRLPLIHSAQMLNIFCCDPVNLALAIAGLILSNQPQARIYAAAHQ